MAKGHKPKKIKSERDGAREEPISMEIIVDAKDKKPTASGDRQFSGARSA